MTTIWSCGSRWRLRSWTRCGVSLGTRAASAGCGWPSTARRAVLAYVFGQRKDKVFRELKALLEPFGIRMFHTDDCGSYQRNITPDRHTVGKKHTQAIERKNLTLGTRIKRLCRRTVCFSKSVAMHDIVVGLVINILEFGWCFERHFHE